MRYGLALSKFDGLFSSFEGLHEDDQLSVHNPHLSGNCLSLEKESPNGHHVIVALYTLVVPGKKKKIEFYQEQLKEK